MKCWFSQTYPHPRVRCQTPLGIRPRRLSRLLHRQTGRHLPDQLRLEFKVFVMFYDNAQSNLLRE